MAITDFLGNQVNAISGVWVRLVNNLTGITYASSARTTVAGRWTAPTAPQGDYTLSTSNVAGGPLPDVTNNALWTVQDDHFFGGDGKAIVWVDPPNGVDDSANYNAAVAAAVALGPGAIVQLAVGTYLGLNLRLASSVWTRGMGYGMTTVRLKPGANAPLFQGDNFLTLAGFNSAIGAVTGFMLSDFVVDGNKANQNQNTSAVAVPSIGVNTSTAPGTLNVVSTAGFAPSGQLLITTLPNPAFAAYTGLTATSFTGVTWMNYGGPRTSGTPVAGVNQGVVLDGTHIVSQACNGINVFGYAFTWRDLRIGYCYGHGSYTEGATGGGEEAVYSGVKSHDNTFDGFSCNGPHDGQWSQCLAYWNGWRGFTAMKTNTGGAQMFSNCHAWGYGQLWGFWLEVAGNIMDSACQAEGAGVNGTTGGQVFLGAGTNQVNGHLFSQNAGTPQRNVRGVVIGDAQHLTIIGTRINAYIEGCEAGLVDFFADSGSRVIVAGFLGAGVAFVNTPAAITDYQFTKTGGAGTGFATRFTKLGIGSTTSPSTGVATLVAGQAQIFTSQITANTEIFIARRVPIGTVGELAARNPGGTDRSAGAWFFVSAIKQGQAVGCSAVLNTNAIPGNVLPTLQDPRGLFSAPAVNAQVLVQGDGPSSIVTYTGLSAAGFTGCTNTAGSNNTVIGSRITPVMKNDATDIETGDTSSFYWWLVEPV